MKKIGLVGGTGPESTLMYYKALNSGIDKITEGKAMPDIAIESVNFRRAWDYVSTGRYDLLSDYLGSKIDPLIAGGSEVVALTAATMHIVFDDLQNRCPITLVSIPKAVAEETASLGIRKVGLLGTIFTMEQDYMKKDLIDAGIEVVIPDKDDRELIAKRILEELELGIVKESTLHELVAIIDKMREDHGIEAVILGCTELPLILNKDNCPVCCLDAVDIHIKKLIGMTLEE